MAIFGSTSKAVLAATLALATFGGTLTTSATPAQAQFVYGGGYGGGYYGGYQPGFYGGGGYGYGGGGYYRGAGYGYGGGYGYAPGGYYGNPYYVRRRRSNGGAIAAGLIGGLAIGALAASAARPSYGYAPAYYGRPVYGRRGGYARVASSGGPCVVERRRFVDAYGRRVSRRERICY